MVVCSPVARSTSSSRSEGAGGNLVRELDETVGDARHRRDDDDDAVARALGVDDAPGDVADALGVADGGAAVLLDEQAHERGIIGAKRESTLAAAGPVAQAATSQGLSVCGGSRPPAPGV